MTTTRREPTLDEAVRILLWSAFLCAPSDYRSTDDVTNQEGWKRGWWSVFPPGDLILDQRQDVCEAAREILDLYSNLRASIPASDARWKKFIGNGEAAAALQVLLDRELLKRDGANIRCGIPWLMDPTSPPTPEKPAAPTPEPDPAYAADIDQFHPSHPDYLPPVKPPVPPAVHGGSPDAPTGHTPRKPQGTAQPTPKPATEQLPATPPKPAAFEVLLDVQRRVKRVEDFFSPTVVDPSGTDVLLQSAHPDTVNCLRRVCVLLQVYGSQQRYQLTNGRVSSKHKSRLPEAISLGLRLGVIGLSTADGKSLTLGDHTVVMPDAELERRAAEQRVRDVKNKPRTIREVMGV